MNMLLISGGLAGAIDFTHGTAGHAQNMSWTTPLRPHPRNYGTGIQNKRDQYYPSDRQVTSEFLSNLGSFERLSGNVGMISIISLYQAYSQPPL